MKKAWVPCLTRLRPLHVHPFNLTYTVNFASTSCDMRGFTQEPDDPLTLALAPPSNETSEEREVRLKKEAEAQRVSDLIDENLRAERAALKKRKIMKMLLLGQSESGRFFRHVSMPVDMYLTLYF